MLIEDNFPGLKLHGIAVIRNNPGGRATANGFSVNHESAIFLGKSANSKVGRLDRSSEQLSRYDQVDLDGPFEWANFRKHGADSDRKNRPKQYYPFYVKEDCSFHIPRMKWIHSEKKWEILEEPVDTEIVIWPTLEGREKVWGWSAKRVLVFPKDIMVKQKNDGSLQVYKKERPKKEGRLPGTWWEKTAYSSNESGTKILKKILNNGQEFPYPKSIYAVLDALKACNLQNKPNALIVDFFAGSGTTLNGVNLLNATDNGNRRCILVTNNEVSEDESMALTDQGHRPGTKEWDKHGICQSVTLPRSKNTILGIRDDGTELEGVWLTGQTLTKENPRAVKHLGFVEGRLLTLKQRRQLVAIIDKVPQSKITIDMPFFVDDEIPASILFDIQQADEWLEALEDKEHITDFYLVTQDNKKLH
jgi:adenine-specific DNA-methyltransferase